MSGSGKMICIRSPTGSGSKSLHDSYFRFVTDRLKSIKVCKTRIIRTHFVKCTLTLTVVLPFQDSSNAQEWVQCLTVAVAHSQVLQNLNLYF
jgi:hypothetical protein